MYCVHHIFPSTGEWGSTTVDTLAQAQAWYDCKLAARNSVPRVLTLYDPQGCILQQHTGCNSSVGRAPA